MLGSVDVSFGLHASADHSAFEMYAACVTPARGFSWSYSDMANYHCVRSHSA